MSSSALVCRAGAIGHVMEWCVHTLKFDGIERNALLRALPASDYNRVSSRLELVAMPQKMIVGEPGEPPTHVYFPQTGSISMVTRLKRGIAVETALVGPEGFYGIGVLLGTGIQLDHAMSQIPGTSRRMSAADFAESLKSSAPLKALLLRYVHALFAQAAQASACNSTHSILERCARWLLMSHDRAGADELRLTQRFLSEMLGVRRAGVTIAAGILQEAGLIQYRRGRVTILNRKGLEDATCECYALLTAAYAKLLPEV